MIFQTSYSSPIGQITLAGDGENLTGLWFVGQKYYPAGQMPRDDSLPVFAQTRPWLDAYFTGERPDMTALPLAPAGSDFRQMIWQLLREIPYGQTTTYGALAREAAKRLGLASMSAQAVGGAVGHNPISIIIPCHRVLGSDGSLTGYAGGVDKKQWLLAHEGAAANPGCHSKGKG